MFHNPELLTYIEDQLLATLAERKTRFYMAMKIPDRKADKMSAAVPKVLSQLSSAPP